MTMLKLQPIQKMRDYTETELDWEYEVEFLKYCQGRGWFVDAFSSREDFGEKVAAAPLVHLTVEQLRALENSMASAGIGRDEAWVHRAFSHRRDSVRIIAELKMGLTAPPIVFRVSDGRFHLLAGQTRLAAGAALGISVPVKMIDFDNGQGRSKLLDLAAEAMWRRCYPDGGAFYKTYDSLPFHDKELHRKEALLFAGASPEPDAVREADRSQLVTTLKAMANEARDMMPSAREVLRDAADLLHADGVKIAALSRPAHRGNDAG